MPYNRIRRERARTANERNVKTMRELTNMIIEHDQVMDKIDDLACDIFETVSAFLSSMKRNVDDADVNDADSVYTAIENVDDGAHHLRKYIDVQLKQLAAYQERRDYLADCIEDYGTDSPLD